MRERDIRIATLEADLARVSVCQTHVCGCVCVCVCCIVEVSDDSFVSLVHPPLPFPHPVGAEVYGAIHRASNDS